MLGIVEVQIVHRIEVVGQVELFVRFARPSQVVVDERLEFRRRDVLVVARSQIDRIQHLKITSRFSKLNLHFP